MAITWFRKPTKRRPAPGRARPHPFRPRLEGLEDRIVPATRVWDGGSAVNNNWMTANNWEGNIAPVAFDDLVFPAGVSGSDKLTTNNFPTGTQFRSITIEDSGYSLDGN